MGEWAQVASKPGQVAQGLTWVTFEYLSICPAQLVAAFPTPGKPTLLPSLHIGRCSISPPWEKTQNGQCAMSLCLWHGRVQLSPRLSPGAVPHSRHSPAQGKELAVAVERHVPQVEDLQPREVAHVGDVAHFVALQVEASDLGTEASKGTRGNLQ